MDLESWESGLGPVRWGSFIPSEAAWTPMAGGVVRTGDTVLHEPHFGRVRDSCPPHPSFLGLRSMDLSHYRARQALLLPSAFCRCMEEPHSQGSVGPHDTEKPPPWLRGWVFFHLLWYGLNGVPEKFPCGSLSSLV